MQDEVNKAITFLSNAKTIMYPTDTIWGIGCDATNSKAVEKIYHIKQRVESKSLIILLETKEKLDNYVKNVPDIAYDLIDSMITPLTIIYPHAINLAKNLIAKDGSIAIRIIRDEFCKELINGFGKPIVSTSANISGEASPIVYNKISRNITDKVDYIVNLYRNTVNMTKPSRIIKLDERGGFKIIRE